MGYGIPTKPFLANCSPVLVVGRIGTTSDQFDWMFFNLMSCPPLLFDLGTPELICRFSRKLMNLFHRTQDKCDLAELNYSSIVLYSES